jgi:hypothetical protein
MATKKVDPYASLPEATDDPYAALPGATDAPTDTQTQTPTPRSLYQRARDKFMNFTEPESGQSVSEMLKRRQSVTDPQSYRDLGETFKETGKGALRGAATLIRHPYNAVKGTAQTAFDLAEALTDPGTESNASVDRLKQQGRDLKDQFMQNPASAIGQFAGQYAVTEGAGKLAGKVIRKTPEMFKTGMRKVLVGTKPAVDLVKKTTEENAAEVARVADENAKQAEARKAQVQKHGEAKIAVKQANEDAAGLQSRKAALERGVEHLDPEFQSDLVKEEKTQRAIGGEKFNAVRRAYDKTVADLPPEEAAERGLVVPAEDLAGDVTEAEKLITGSTENLKVFRDILSRVPEVEEVEEEPASLPLKAKDGTTQIPKGHPLYEVLKQARDEEAAAQPPVEPGEPAGFRDVQGYRQEIGKALAHGELAPDVYRALKKLHEKLSDRLQAMADQSGVGKDYKQANKFYSGYMDTFRDYKSPVRKAMETTERGQSIKQFQGKDQSGVEALARYNPELAKRANYIRDSQAEAKAIPAKGPKPKAEPTLGPKPTPAEPVIQRPGAEELRKANLDALDKTGAKIRYRGHVIASNGAVFGVLGSLLARNLPYALKATELTGMVLGGTEALQAALGKASVREFLSAPTKAQLEMMAQLPEDQRGDLAEALRPTVKAARAKGIPVAPAVAALVGLTAPARNAAEAKARVAAAQAQ